MVAFFLVSCYYNFFFKFATNELRECKKNHLINLKQKKSC